jgi:hypothetical protein
MTTPGKQTIYVDVDDEITTIIDKMNSTDARVIALVLPKRATVFQSIVNMKLLKRRADSAHKNVVLITSEAGLLPLAGAVGLHVAATLQSKPEIPAAPAGGQSPEDIDEDEAVSLAEDLPAASKSMAIGALAANHTPGVNELADDVIELDNAPKHGHNPIIGSQPSRELAAAAAKPTVGHNKGKKGFKVPNFLSFRKWMLLGGLVLVLFIVFLVFAFTVLPKATIAIKTNTTDVNAEVSLTLDTKASSVDVEGSVIPAQTQQQQKAYTQTAPATGQKNLGNKASGSIQFSVQKCAPDLDQPDSIPAGVGLKSNDLVFITQSKAVFTIASPPSGSCVTYSSNSINVTAQQGGSSYNLNSASFEEPQSGATGTGSTSGGTDRNVQVVQQSDIDSAKQKLTSTDDKENIKRQLQQNLENANLVALPATFTAKVSGINVSAKVDDQATNVTVSENITYTMYGAKQSDLKKLLDKAINDQIDTAKQSIQDDGLSDATYNVPKSDAGDQLDMSVAVTASVGPHLDVDKLTEAAVGKKSGEVKEMVKNNPGVIDVEVNYSPFWVTKAPKASKITVVFEKAATSDGN